MSITSNDITDLVPVRVAELKVSSRINKFDRQPLFDARLSRRIVRS